MKVIIRHDIVERAKDFINDQDSPYGLYLKDIAGKVIKLRDPLVLDSNGPRSGQTFYTEAASKHREAVTWNIYEDYILDWYSKDKYPEYNL